jgi:hypothetical protein
VRLAAKLTGWNIDIISADESRVEATAEAAEAVAAKPRTNLEDSLIAAVNEHADETQADDPQTDALSGQESDDTPAPVV